MSSPVTAAAAAKVFTQALADAWAPTILGAPASVKSDTSAEGTGWLVTVRVSGAATGALVAWFEREGAIACATKVLGLEAPADDQAVGPVLVGIVKQAVAAAETSPELAGLIAADPTVQTAGAPRGAQMLSASWADAPACRFGVVAELSTGPAVDNLSLSTDARLDAVLDVDLPLVVRFGRTVMPLRAVADLSPGSIVDMGRSPDDPVELLVGERLIARGEVVIVGGNYGVRITELTSGRRSSDLEARS
jgi:flagellar motor switch protein FliN